MIALSAAMQKNVRLKMSDGPCGRDCNQCSNRECSGRVYDVITKKCMCKRRQTAIDMTPGNGDCPYCGGNYE